jgi:predicted RecB family nuclease
MKDKISLKKAGQSRNPVLYFNQRSNTMLKITDRNIYDFKSPSPCEKRLFLRHSTFGMPMHSDFEKMLIALGRKHEKDYRKTLGNVIDLEHGTPEERIRRTMEIIKAGKPAIIRKGLLSYKSKSMEAELESSPGYIKINGKKDITILETKVVSDTESHSEIYDHMYLHSYLLRKTAGVHPSSLKVLLSDDEEEEISPISQADENRHIIAIVKKFADIMGNKQQPYTPVRVNKCRDCCYADQCMKTAAENKEVSMVFGVTDGIARALEKIGIRSADQLLSGFTAETLGAKVEFQMSNGEDQRVGPNRGAKIIEHAYAWVKDELLLRPSGFRKHLEDIEALIDSKQQVMFDLEGIPSNIDGKMERIYLWGLKMLGKDGSKEDLSVMSDLALTKKADRDTWDSFLKKAEETFEKYGDVPFIHWSPYEKVKVRMYGNDRYPDASKKPLIKRILNNCTDLLPIIRDSVVLNRPGGHGIKLVEKVAGFKRKVAGFGDWSIVMFQEVCRLHKEKKEEEKALRLADLKTYNDEDLESPFFIMEKWFFPKYGEALANRTLQEEPNLTAREKAILQKVIAYSQSLQSAQAPALV